MRVFFVLPLVLVATVQAVEPPRMPVDLSGEIDGRGLVMAESDKPVYRVHLTGSVDGKGEGNGTLLLDVTPRPLDEFGFLKSVEPLPPIKLDCSLKLIKKRKIMTDDPATGIHRLELEWRLYEIKGPKITSALSAATESSSKWSYANFLVSDRNGKDRCSVALHGPRPFPPCHPGCFPAGTMVVVPGGYRDIETLGPGDVVTTIAADGVPGHGTVSAVFVTRNELVAVKTDSGVLRTTETQPLALADGTLRAAGALKPGDRIHSWRGQERGTARVHSVEATGREARVFNLILEEPTLFVAGGFLARSKPPADPVAQP